MTLDALLDSLRASTMEFLATLDGVTRSEWTWKPEPETWSVYEIAEHTCTVQRGIERLFSKKLLEQPLAAETARPAFTDAQIEQRLAPGGRGVRAPEMVLPKGRWATKEELAQAFTASTEAHIAWVQAHTEVDLRDYGSIHPMLGMLDGVQWLVMLAAHNRRHAAQVRALRERYAALG